MNYFCKSYFYYGIKADFKAEYSSFSTISKLYNSINGHGKKRFANLVLFTNPSVRKKITVTIIVIRI